MTDQLPREFRLACSLVGADIPTIQAIQRIHRPKDRASITVIAWLIYNNPRHWFSYKCIADMIGKKSHATVMAMIARCKKPKEMYAESGAKAIFDEFTRLDQQRESWSTRPVDGYSVLNAYVELVSDSVISELKEERKRRRLQP